MIDTGYLFLAERLENVLRHYGGSIDQHEIEDWDTIVDDDSEEFIAITADTLHTTVLAIAHHGVGPDPRATENHAHHLEQLRTHNDCAAAIAALTAQRDDHLSALQDTGSYCRTDSYEGKYGDDYLSIELVLDQLRPGLPHRRYRKLLDPDNCPVCGDLWGHDEFCAFEDNHAALDQRRAAAIEAHVICASMGEALTAHIRACLDEIERLAAHVVQHQVYAEDDGVALPADGMIDAIRLADLDWQYDPTRPATIAVARHAPLES